MGSLKPRVEAGLRRLERKIGIDREGRTVWVWLLPPAVGLVTAALVPFMPGLPAEMGLFDRLTLAVFGMFTMTAIAGIYLISFDNDHNQQAPVDDPPAHDSDEGPEVPPTPVNPPPPQWRSALATSSSAEERDGEPAQTIAPQGARLGRNPALGGIPNREHDRRGVVDVVPDLLVGDQHPRRRPEWLAAAEVAREPWVRAARDLNPDAVTSSKDVGHRPQVDADRGHSVGCAAPVLGSEPHHPIADVARVPGRVDVADADEEIGVLERGADEQFGTHRSDRLDITHQDG